MHGQIACWCKGLPNKEIRSILTTTSQLARFVMLLSAGNVALIFSLGDPNWAKVCYARCKMSS